LESPQIPEGAQIKLRNDKAFSPLRYFTGCEFPFFNGVFNDYKNNELELINNLEKATQFFTDQDTPFIWWWTQQTEVPTKIKACLDMKGFQFLGDFLGIAANLNEIKFAALGERIEIGIVNNEKEYQFFLNTVCEVFQMSEAIKSDLKAMYNSYGSQGKFRHYLGYYAGEPVATLTSYIDGPVVGLYNGATLTNFQKHGLCTSLADLLTNSTICTNCAINSGCWYNFKTRHCEPQVKQSSVLFTHLKDTGLLHLRFAMT
jgi:hypothetical protein